MKQKLSSPSFADLFLGQRKVKLTFFSQINTVIDWAGLGIEDIVPDSTTVCRFRNILVEADLYDTLLEEFNRQLEAKGIIVKRGVFIDASITNTPRRPRGGKSYEVVEDRKEDENMEASEKAMLKEVVKPNVDTEARWVKKMGKLHFGYKRHTVTDDNGLVLAEETTAANESGKIRWTFKNTCAAYYGIHCLQLVPNTRDYCVKLYQII